MYANLFCSSKESICQARSSGNLFYQRQPLLRRSCASTRRCSAPDILPSSMSGSSGPFLILHHGTAHSIVTSMGPLPFLMFCRVLFTIFLGTAVAPHTADLLLSCQWWVISWVWEIAMEKISSLILSRVNVYTLTSTASSTRFVTVYYLLNYLLAKTSCHYFLSTRGRHLTYLRLFHSD